MVCGEECPRAGVLLWHLHTGPPTLLSAAHQFSARRTKGKAIAHRWLIISVYLPQRNGKLHNNHSCLHGKEGEKDWWSQTNTGQSFAS